MYLQIRYYNTNQGRFFQEDTYLGDITDPLTLNRYAYVKNSPLNYVDPSGHIPASMTGGHMPVGTSQTGSRRVAENNAKTTQNPAYQGGTLEEEMERAEESGEYKDCVRAVIRSIIRNPDADRAIWKVLLPLGDIREDYSAIGDRYLKYIYGIDNVADTKESYQIRMTVYEILWEAEINGVDVNSVTNREIDSLFVPYFSKRVEEAYQIADVAIATFASVAQSKLMEYCQWKVAEQANRNLSDYSSGIKEIYRAVSPEEYEEIMLTGQFKGTEGTFAAKEFGNSLEDTLKFANHPINTDKAAIIKVTIPEDIYNQLQHMELDTPIFKSGTTVVEPEMLDVFNKNIIKIEHVY